MATKKDDGIRALNSEFARFDQVNKPQRYHLAEADHVEAFDDDYEVRTCDLGRFLTGDAGDRQRFARELGDALADIGFAVLVGHGVDEQTHRTAHDDVAAVFDRDLDEKMRFRATRHGSVNQGYFPIAETSEIHPDEVEGWVFCRRAFALDDQNAQLERFWPDPTLEPRFRELCRRHEELILPVMQSMLLYLGCDPHLYDQRLTRTNFGLRLNTYPAVSATTAKTGAARLLGHEDVDLFTLLPAPTVEGLQVLNRNNMKWIRLAPPPGSIILNTGDYMQRISNDILPSTTHRVSSPRDLELRQQVRTSVPMAIYVWEDEMLEVLPGLGEPKYEAIRAEVFHTRSTSKFYGDGYAVE